MLTLQQHAAQDAGRCCRRAAIGGGNGMALLPHGRGGAAGVCASTRRGAAAPGAAAAAALAATAATTPAWRRPPTTPTPFPLHHRRSRLPAAAADNTPSNNNQPQPPDARQVQKRQQAEKLRQLQHRRRHDNMTQRLVSAATLPFAALALPQLARNAASLAAGDAAAVAAVSWVTHIAALGGNALMCTYFAARGEGAAVGIQVIGMATTAALLWQLRAAGAMPAAAFAGAALLASLVSLVGALRSRGLVPTQLWVPFQLLVTTAGVLAVPQVVWAAFGGGGSSGALFWPGAAGGGSWPSLLAGLGRAAAPSAVGAAIAALWLARAILVVGSGGGNGRGSSSAAAATAQPTATPPSSTTTPPQPERPNFASPSTPEQRLARLQAAVERLPGWCATALFALSPLPQLARSFADLTALAGLAPGTMLLALVGNALCVPRALWTRDRAWTVGSTWGCLAMGWAQLLAMALGRNPANGGLAFLPMPAFLGITAALASYLVLVAAADARAKGLGRNPFRSYASVFGWV